MITIPLLTPSDGNVGANFSSARLAFAWGEPRYEEGIASLPEKVFTLQVATNASFASIIATETVTDLYTTALSIDLLPETTYYWRVACNGEYSGDFSTFYTTFAAPNITITNDISIEGNKTKASWTNDNPDINEMRISYGAGEPATNIFAQVPIEEESFILTQPTTNASFFLAGEKEFDYSATLATAGLNTVVIGDGTEVTINDLNYVVVDS